MTRKHSLSRQYEPGMRRGSQAKKTLADAYCNVFGDGGTLQERHMVLADLANYCGWCRVSGPGTASDDRAFADGMRAAYGRIFRFLQLSDEEREQLENAARQEAVTDATEGTI